jgi:chemotaxis signal transduction protein
MPTLTERADPPPDYAAQLGSPTAAVTCLKFAIDIQSIGLLESEFVQEVITIRSSHIIPVPNKPSCILGILSRRRRVYWGVDLAMLLGMQPLNPNISLYEVILISMQQLSLALVVPQIMGVVNIPHEHISNDITLMPATLKSYLKGYARERENIAYLLKAESILRSNILHS